MSEDKQETYINLEKVYIPDIERLRKENVGLKEEVEYWKAKIQNAPVPPQDNLYNKKLRHV